MSWLTDAYYRSLNLFTKKHDFMFLILDNGIAVSFYNNNQLLFHTAHPFDMHKFWSYVDSERKTELQPQRVVSGHLLRSGSLVPMINPQVGDEIQFWNYSLYAQSHSSYRIKAVYYEYPKITVRDIHSRFDQPFGLLRDFTSVGEYSGYANVIIAISYPMVAFDQKFTSMAFITDYLKATHSVDEVLGLVGDLILAGLLVADRDGDLSFTPAMTTLILHAAARIQSSILKPA